MDETIHGKINLPDKINITDPSYDEDVWCRINNFPIDPGVYECYTLTASDIETDGWGERIARIGIRKPRTLSTHCERKGSIGVDSGMAGFFACDNKTEFDRVLENFMDDVFLSDKAFFSSSGYGDGGYDVYAGYQNGKIVEVYIEFIGSEE